MQPVYCAGDGHSWVSTSPSSCLQSAEKCNHLKLLGLFSVLNEGSIRIKYMLKS